MTQEELLPLIYKKDERAFTHLYNHYAKSLFGVISGLIKEPEEAEDVLQETFIKIWNHMDTYQESKGRFYTWMLTIARNSAIEKLRSKGYHHNQKNNNVDNFVYIFNNHKRQKERFDLIGIQEFIQKMKPKCIKIIDLLFFKGFTQLEVSEELDIPMGAVKTQNRNCIHDLRTLLDEI
jgi:RNA polymerase sigma-70 factor (ECF subfamily)